MTAISEDTPAGGPEELQWQIDQLTEQLKLVNTLLDRERTSHREKEQRYFKLQETYATLTDRLTVGVLRKAGYIVAIEEIDTCGEEYL